MIYIDKTSPESLELKAKLEKWKHSHRKFLSESYKDSQITGETIWKYLDDNRTEEIDKSLLKERFLIEQGYLCGYCGARINLENSHIEHIKPKSLYKENTYDYDNLILSCYGCSKNIIHIVNNPNESLDSISKYWGVRKEDIEDLYLDENRKNLISKEYNLDLINLKDSIWIIKIENNDQQHCGMKKLDEYFDLFISPLMIDCFNNFKYRENSYETIIGTSHEAKQTIQILGLNNNRKMNIYRSEFLKKGKDLQQKILTISKGNKSDFQKVKDKWIETLSKKENNHYSPFFFVTIAALEGRFLSS